jgi:putative transposase
MDNHLLAVPENETSLARGIGLTNMVYTQYLNRKRKQSGRIWQNRFFFCVVEKNEYLWAAARYIESNPLKVGLIEKAEDYRWPSAKAHLTEATDDLLSQPDWLDPSARADYADFFRIEDAEQNNAIRKATRTVRLYGSESFIDQQEDALSRRIRSQKAGRPRKQKEDNAKSWTSLVLR